MPLQDWERGFGLTRNFLKVATNFPSLLSGINVKIINNDVTSKQNNLKCVLHLTSSTMQNTDAATEMLS